MIQGLQSDMPSIYPGYFYLPAQLCLLMMSFETGLQFNQIWQKPDTHTYGIVNST